MRTTSAPVSRLERSSGCFWCSWCNSPFYTKIAFSSEYALFRLLSLLSFPLKFVVTRCNGVSNPSTPRYDSVVDSTICKYPGVAGVLSPVYIRIIHRGEHLERLKTGCGSSLGKSNGRIK